MIPTHAAMEARFRIAPPPCFFIKGTVAYSALYTPLTLTWNIRSKSSAEQFSRLPTCAIPQNHNVWHYHDEIEFILILEGKGTFFIGDCITPFSAGDCVLIGSNVPHYWLFDEEYLLPESDTRANVVVAHFLRDFVGQVFWSLPELSPIRRLIEYSKDGIMCRCSDKNLENSFLRLMATSGLERILALLHTLHIFDQHPDKEKLVSADYNIQYHDDDMNRMNLILGFINDNYKVHVHLDEVADLSGMTKNSFCRFFKQKTGRTLTDFVTKLRISNAQKILGNTHGSIKEACYESGFNNLVSFHKAFKSITGNTPKAYREMFWKQSL